MVLKNPVFHVVILLIALNCELYAWQTPLQERFDEKVQDFAFILPQLKGVEGVPGTGLRAEECGTCHTHIYEEWKASTHASALADIQFQGELAKPDSPKWLCLNCHIPIQNQRSYRVTGLENGDPLKPVKQDNPHFDPKLQAEAVTCAVCHVRPDDQGKSVIIGAIGSSFAPHPVKRDPQFVRNICMRCHNPRGEALTPNLTCWFHTYDELKNAEDPDLDSKDCASCHMPMSHRKTVPAYDHLPIRQGHQHHWTGSGVPKTYGAYDTLLDRGYIPGLNISVQSPEAPVILLENKNAGHWLPTGDPERFILVIVRLWDKNDHILESRKLRIGQEWEWNPAKKLGDNRLKHGEKRTWRPQLAPLNKRAKRLTVEALHVRLSTKNAVWLMKAGPIREDYLPNGSKLVAQAHRYYPFASYIFKEDINLSTGERKVASPQQLIELSKQEQNKPMNERDY